MSTNRPAPPEPHSTAPPPRPMMRGGPFGGQMGPPQKAKAFVPSAKRLAGQLRSQAPLVILVLCFSIVSSTLTVIGPGILGRATNIIFAGYLGGHLPATLTHAQAVAGAHAAVECDEPYDHE